MGFQLYSTTREIFVSAIPDSLPLENAAVLPVSISTAATALFVELKLPFPSLNPKPLGRRILVWGGSSSVGCSMIQLAVAAGLEVVTTASPANHDLMRSLGASQVFNYHDSDVTDKLLAVLKAGDLVMDAISTENTQTKCGEILGRLGGGTLPVTQPQAGTFPDNVNVVFGKISTIIRVASTNQPTVICIHLGFTALEVGNAVWREYVPRHWLPGNFKQSQIPLSLKVDLRKYKRVLTFYGKVFRPRRL